MVWNELFIILSTVAGSLLFGDFLVNFLCKLQTGRTMRELVKISEMSKIPLWKVFDQYKMNKEGGGNP